MTALHKLKTSTGVRQSLRRGFTLVELLASMTIMTLLMGTMTSAILIASRALPDPGSTAAKKAQATDIVDQIAGEIFYATSISEAVSNTVTFTVADRGHGGAGPETIRYVWSGTPGDPLTRRYNDGTVVNICEDVQLLELSYGKRVGQLNGLPRVLLVVDDDGSITAQDEAKRQMIESWGFTVQILSDDRTLAEFEVALQSADVVYLAQALSAVPPTLPALLALNPAVGIVCEERWLFPDLGFSTSSNSMSIDSIEILDNTHEITKPFPLGTLRIFSSNDAAIYPFAQLAPGRRTLAQDELLTNDMLLAIDVNGALSDGTLAPARRTSLPWGDRITAFDFNNLTKDGLTLMRRAIVWAAAPVGVAGIRITLQVGSDPNGRVETQVQLLNSPEAQ